MAEAEILVGPRRSGKTTRLIERACRTGEYIVTINQGEAHRIFRVAVDAGKNMPLPISFSEFVTGEFYARGIRGFLIDNVEMLVADLARGVPVPAITVNVDEEPVRLWPFPEPK